MTPLVLLILDGWGIAPKHAGNAIELARKPNFDQLWKEFPHTQLKAHGKYVGLPASQVGNSESGHMNIGAGQKIEQDAVRISEAITDKRFQKNTALLQTIKHVKQNNSRLHLMGVVSDGESPHSCLEHLYALVDLAHTQKVKNIFLHLFTDGRDSPQFSAIKILDELFHKINGKAELASLIGRFYAMDRSKNWPRTKKAYEALTDARGDCFETYEQAVTRAYNQGATDEYVEPAILCQKKESRIQDNDGVIFFNLRSDRARQLTKCFVQKDFNQQNPGSFKRGTVLKNTSFCALTDFGPDLDSILTAFPSADIENTLPIILRHKKQAYIAETEKYAHMTYFINGGYADPVNGEKRKRIDSKKIKSYATKPDMRAYGLTKEVRRFLQIKKFDFVAVNLANPDMVGHTGDLKATVRAIEHCDKNILEIAKLVAKRNGTLIITADHGNAETMLDLKTNEIYPRHTTNPVPFILVNKKLQKQKLQEGILGNIAPTIYKIMDIKYPEKELLKPLF